MSENILHLVLARVPDAPEGSKGISLFLVPKYLPTADGKIGERNPIFCGAIEEKMGIHGNSTCQMNLDGARGWIIGQPNKGLNAMAGGFAELIMDMRPVAKESRIQYQKVAKGATRASGRVPGDIAALKAQLKAEGKVAFPVEVDVFDEHGTLAAQVQVDWYLSEKR